MLRISLRERGDPAFISNENWDRLNLSVCLGPIADAGVVRLVPSQGGVIVFPAHFVGKAVAPQFTLSISAKDEQLQEAISAIGTRSRAVAAAQLSMALPGGEDLVLAFLAALQACVNEGVPWSYVQRLERASRVRGRPAFTPTISRLLAQGISHQIYAHVSERQTPHAFSRLVRAASSIVVAESEPSVAGQISLWCRAIPEDGMRSEDASDLTSAGRDLLATEELSATARELIQLAISIIERSAARGFRPLLLPTGRAEFYNLEVAWEVCVSALLEDLMSVVPNASVQPHGLARAGIRLLPDGGPLIDPDSVVVVDSQYVLIADAKYKVLDGAGATPPSSDVYQLAAYLRSTSAALGLLIYLGIEDNVRIVGNSKDGAVLGAVQIAPATILAKGKTSLSFLLSDHVLLHQRLHQRAGHSVG